MELQGFSGQFFYEGEESPLAILRVANEVFQRAGEQQSGGLLLAIVRPRERTFRYISLHNRREAVDSPVELCS